MRRLRDPIVVDLDGNGIELTPRIGSNVFFDMDADGRKELTGWVGKNDGFLAIDENKNGKIDSITELIGDEGRSGFAELASHDGNGDKIINASDAVWATLKVWRDANGNGVTDTGELLTMAQAGIKAIDLNFTTVNFTAEGNTIHEQATFERTNGATGTIVDAWLEADNVATARDAAATGNATIDALPEIPGYGDVGSLHTSMKADGALTSLVSTVVNLRLDQVGSARAQVEQILYRWAGTGGVAADSRGPSFDGRKVATLEKFLGTPFAVNGVTQPNAQAVPSLVQAWTGLVDGVMARLLLAGAIRSVIPDTTYDAAKIDRLISLDDAVGVLTKLAVAMPVSDAAGSAQYLSSAVGIAHVVAQDQGTSIDANEYREVESLVLSRYGLTTFLHELDSGINSAHISSSGQFGDNGLFILTNESETIYLTGSHQGIYAQGGNDKLVVQNASSPMLLDGGAGNDTLLGGYSDDWLDGGTGNDTLYGGQGNDTYVVDAAGDVVAEGSNGGNDTVRASITYGLGKNVENLTLTGTAALVGTGNGFDNVLIGNAGANKLYGLDGNDTLDGGTGIDRLEGGAGNDTYIVDNAGDIVVDTSGSDTVRSTASFVLGKGLENLILLGTAALRGIGNASNNTIQGNSGANVLNGGKGNDTLIGGAGDDSYFTDGSDSIQELANEGTDTVYASVDYSLSPNVENLVLQGVEDLRGYGNDLANAITGNAGDNLIDGATGADLMTGGSGDDTYVVDDAGDRIVEAAGGGTDTVQTTLATYTMAAEVDNLMLSYNGDPGIVRRVAGNVLANVITGSQFVDALSGGDGNDVLDGGAGKDQLKGGKGDDFYYVDDSSDVVAELASEGIDTVQAYGVSYVLSANVENLTLTGYGEFNATGNTLANRLVGNDYANILDGKAGADVMTGGGGNDTYVVDDAGDVVVENPASGLDTVLSSVSFVIGGTLENLTLTGTAALAGTGNAFDNVLIGNAGANKLYGLDGNDALDGGAGADLMYGGRGRDSYFVDNAADVISETGTDVDQVSSSVTFILPTLVEQLTLTGVGNINATGNRQDNFLYGNAGNNTLDGGVGRDQMYGGKGNDVYIVDNVYDYVSELSNEGTDTVQSLVNYALSGNLENLTLLGNDDISAIGNELANVLTGNAGDNWLDGQQGNDRMIGGAGDDTYIVDSTGDAIVEQAGGGTDTVQTQLGSMTLAAEVENVQLFFSYPDASARNATGNGLDNTIQGNNGINVLTGLGGNDTIYGYDAADTLNGGDGNDRLDGGTGDDTMIGGAGDDTYIVDSARDRVTEAAASGTDKVFSSVSYILGSDVENLELTGASSIDAAGNASGNNIVGNAGANNIDGRAGADTMAGDDGNDTYTVDDLGDIVIELPGGGQDLVRSSVDYSLGVGVEDLTLLGTANLQATGNELGNVITGNAGNNYIIGGLGSDLLSGAAGADRFIYQLLGDLGNGYERIADFSVAQKDLLDFRAIDANETVVNDQAFAYIGSDNFTAAGQLRIGQSGADVFVQLNTNADLGADATLWLSNINTLPKASILL